MDRLFGLTIFLLLLVAVSSLSIQPFDPYDCQLRCKGMCVPPRFLGCKGGLVKDVCNCCDVCAKQQGEPCGGFNQWLGKCDKGLMCKPSFHAATIALTGVCVPELPKPCKIIATCRKLCPYGFLPPRPGSCIRCDCAPAPCKVITTCKKLCPYGFLPPKPGSCMRCDCAPAPLPPPPPPPRPVPCLKLECTNFCKYGYKLPAPGECPTCECNKIPIIMY